MSAKIAAATAHKKHAAQTNGSQRRTRPFALSPRRAQQGLCFLEACRDKYVEAHDYDNAAILNARYEDLKQRLSNTSSTDMLTLQGTKQHAMLARHVKDLQDRKKLWQQRTDEFEAWEAAQWNDLLQRQQMEFQSHLQEMHQDAVTYHCGKDVVNLRCKMHHLASLRRYAEASELQAQADDLELFERELFAIKQDGQKAAGGKGPFIQKQTTERNGLEIRIAAKRRELDSKKHSDLELLKTKQQNERNNMSSAHVREQQCASGKRPRSAPLSRGHEVSRPSSAAGERDWTKCAEEFFASEALAGIRAFDVQITSPAAPARSMSLPANSIPDPPRASRHRIVRSTTMPVETGRKPDNHAARAARAARAERWMSEGAAVLPCRRRSMPSPKSTRPKSASRVARSSI